jgi:hypothetical protein
MLKVMWLACLLLVAIVVVAIVWPAATGAPPGEWGALTGGSPSASSPNLIPNGSFDAENLAGWAHRPHVIIAPTRLPDRSMDTELPKAGVDPKGGRSGGALRLPDQKAKRAEVASSWTKPISHCDWFFDGYARATPKSGKGWVAIEFVFEGPNGKPIASFLSWRGFGGGRPEATPGQLQREFAPSEDGWGRVPIRTSSDLQANGLAMPDKPSFLTVNLRLFLEDAAADAWFDDVELRDMKAGR